MSHLHEWMQMLVREQAQARHIGCHHISALPEVRSTHLSEIAICHSLVRVAIVHVGQLVSKAQVPLVQCLLCYPALLHASAQLPGICPAQVPGSLSR